MSRFFLGFLALSALALMIGHATAGGGSANDANQMANNGAVMIVETYTASSSVPSNENNNFQPLPDDPGVEVAPAPSITASAQPVMVEDDMLIEQTEDGE